VQRESDAGAHNARLEKFINDLAFDVADAIDEYVGMVLDNSQYPDVFPVEHEHSFDLATRELTVTALVPAPSAVPSVKEFKYVKAKDEITEVSLSAKAVKDRYAGAVQQVALRTLHEAFEADRLGKIKTVTATVAVSTIAAHSGLVEQIPLVQVAADREAFTAFDLTNVVPSATLAHLGASVSKTPYDLVPAAVGSDVRTRKA
jgi:restriction system protein